MRPIGKNYLVFHTLKLNDDGKKLLCKLSGVSGKEKKPEKSQDLCHLLRLPPSGSDLVRGKLESKAPRPQKFYLAAG